MRFRLDVLAMPNGLSAKIERLRVSVFTIPTDTPESDGSFEWDHTTMVMVQVESAGQEGIGYTYADEATATLIEKSLKPVVEGCSTLDVTAAWSAMVHRIRNLGRPGVCSMAIAAVDCALWDLKAKLVGLPLVKLLGQVRDGVPLYGSGGFTSYNNARLEEQLRDWIGSGIPRVKMKIGRNAHADLERVHIAREAIGRDAELFVDANGAYDRKLALKQAEILAERERVTWFEEPVSSDDLEGLRLIRDRAPAGMDIAAGEYGYDLVYFRRMIESGAVDVLQADATRCAGITGFLQVAALCQAHNIPLSAHTAPALHMHVCCAAFPLVHLEYFHDHVRIERMFFDGVPWPVAGALHPDLSRPGNGLELKRADALRFAA